MRAGLLRCAMMKLIVAEVVLEMPGRYDPMEVLPKPEGTTYIPWARVYVRTVAGTPRYRKPRPYHRRPPLVESA